MILHLSAVVLSVTLLIYINHLTQEYSSGVSENVTWQRCVFSIIVSLLVAAWGLKRKSLNYSGAIAGIAVGLIHTYSSYCFLACLFTFFYTSSKATHYRSDKKKKVEEDFKEGGQRNWQQVICNGGASTQLALLYLLSGGPEEIPIDFQRSYVRSWLAVGAIAALAGANGDTWASEIGTVAAKSKPFLITSFRRVPVGTNGGCTFIGMLVSALGGTIVGLSYLLALIMKIGSSFDVLNQSLLLLFVGTFSGFFGSVFDSLIGATLQYSGMDAKTGKIVETPGPNVKHISGRPILKNHTVNLIMTIVTSVAVPTITAQIF
ncbi:hypothetical protein JTE90_029444 [Oedothorax gibbosus]|uniref:Transmembrane protein 19 n=1 Tax=Oedothorax gibbosus TaxID=931172 RepID=A0AAV6U2F2_9ARAC|nr:hypothetical protein JTE90_029444 [Oedothorax gibbosus]